MTLTLNDLWNEFNDVIRSQSINNNIAQKMRAVNLGNLFLSQRMIELKKAPTELYVQSDLVTTDETNYVSLPDDFLSLISIWYKENSSYNILADQAFIPYQTLKKNQSTLFFDTSNTGTISNASIVGDKIYFDTYFSENGTDEIKIEYNSIHEDVSAYDRLTVDTVTGFIVGEGVTASLSGATATIKSIDSDNLTIDVNADGRSGSFIKDDVITGDTSSSTATLSENMTEKPQELTWMKNKKYLVIYAWAVSYLDLIGSMEVEEKDNVLTSLINNFGILEKKGFLRIRMA